MKNKLSLIALSTLLTLGGAGTAFAWHGDAEAPAASSSEEAPRARGRRARGNRTKAHRGRRARVRAGLSLRHMRRALSRLDLSDAQKTQIRTIMTGARAQVRDNRAGMRELSPEARRALFHSLKAETRSAIMNVLTDAQKTQLREMRANHRAQRGNRARRGHRGQRGPNNTN